MDLAQDKLKLIQCFHCLQYGHTSNKCDQKDEPPICAQCAVPGHTYKDCDIAQSKCHHCQVQGHPATARVCPAYRKVYRETMKLLEDHIISKYLATTSVSTPPVSTPPMSTPPPKQDVDDLISAVNASMSVAYTATDFITSLFGILRASSPTRPDNIPPMTYDLDLSFEDDNMAAAAQAPVNQVVRQPLPTQESSQPEPPKPTAASSSVRLNNTFKSEPPANLHNCTIVYESNPIDLYIQYTNQKDKTQVTENILLGKGTIAVKKTKCNINFVTLRDRTTWESPTIEVLHAFHPRMIMKIDTSNKTTYWGRNEYYNDPDCPYEGTESNTLCNSLFSCSFQTTEEAEKLRDVLTEASNKSSEEDTKKIYRMLDDA